jgi:hypothetical protein
MIGCAVANTRPIHKNSLTELEPRYVTIISFRYENSNAIHVVIKSKACTHKLKAV